MLERIGVENSLTKFQTGDIIRKERSNRRYIGSMRMS